MKRLILLTLIVLLLSSCNRKVLEIDVKLGVRIDSKSNFFAYYTAAPATDISSIKLFVSSEDSIVKPKMIYAHGNKNIYPIQFKVDEDIIVRPTYLEYVIGAENEKYMFNKNTVVLGYFRNLVEFFNSRTDVHMDNEEELIQGGLIWGEPNGRLEQKIKNKMTDCVKFASKYGADAIIDIMVFYDAEGHRVYGRPGIYIYGKAIRYTDK